MLPKVVALAVVVAIGCGPTASGAHSPPAAATAAPASSSDRGPVNTTGVVILANHCAHLGKEASREAEATMSRLVAHCNNVLTQPLRFGVVLEVGGSIGFARADKGTDEIPMCVVTQKLRHRVRLSAPCRMDVRFEPSSLPAH